ncbi:hypothetical protein Rhe02_30220 [Rhizocola hellebori]|uniref:Uncharacterized protein n=1 Tax=Rhizocola hellebori TaxID=1392758 RepID=A0A8J3Q8C5_9ACTN|nr:hypothetical protein Rhe02_30220 [Rhizocola hellebori]
MGGGWNDTLYLPTAGRRVKLPERLVLVTTESNGLVSELATTLTLATMPAGPANNPEIVPNCASLAEAGTGNTASTTAIKTTARRRGDIDM